MMSEPLLRGFYATAAVSISLLYEETCRVELLPMHPVGNVGAESDPGTALGNACSILGSFSVPILLAACLAVTTA